MYSGTMVEIHDVIKALSTNRNDDWSAGKTSHPDRPEKRSNHYMYVCRGFNNLTPEGRRLMEYNWPLKG